MPWPSLVASVFPKSPVMPLASRRHASGRRRFRQDVRRPEVAGLGLAAGLEVMDGGFVDLSVKGAPMFVLISGR